MGQYHVCVNLDKREFIHPYRLGDGLKLMEFGNSAGGLMTGLAILLAVSNGRGGGDLDFDESDEEVASVVGRWGGDRIAIVGDYAEDTDLPASFDAGTIYERCVESQAEADQLQRDQERDGIWDPALPYYRDISPLVRKAIEADGVYRFEGETGWINRIDRAERNKKFKPELRPDMIATSYTIIKPESEP